jgi:hypothetical protein
MGENRNRHNFNRKTLRESSRDNINTDLNETGSDGVVAEMRVERLALVSTAMNLRVP